MYTEGPSSMIIQARSQHSYIQCVDLLNSIPNYLLHVCLEYTGLVVVGNDLCRSRCRLPVFHTRHDDLRVNRTSPTLGPSLSGSSLIYTHCASEVLSYRDLLCLSVHLSGMVRHCIEDSKHTGKEISKAQFDVHQVPDIIEFNRGESEAITKVLD
jgi:hypothetical protein